jgi:thioredoxin 1
MANAIDANAGNWNAEVLKSIALTVVYFWHDKCQWCERLNPIFNQVTEEYAGRIKFVKLNVLETPENQELASEQGVMGTPTLIFFCQGRSLGQTVSYMTKEELEEVLGDMLERYKSCLTQSSDIRNYIA